VIKILTELEIYTFVMLVGFAGRCNVMVALLIHSEGADFLLLLQNNARIFSMSTQRSFILTFLLNMYAA
jgi:hypothetical protein